MSRHQIPTKFRVSAYGLGVILVLAIAYLYSGVLGQSITKRADTVTVILAETGGLFEKSSVTYRGVKVGTVDTIGLDAAGVIVKFKLTTEKPIPAKSTAVVRSLSPAGEQFLDLQPQSDKPPYLKDGSRIAASATVTPTSVAKALSSVDRLMAQVDEGDVETVMRELSKAFADPDDLGRLLTEGQKLTQTINDNWPATQRILANGSTVLKTGKDQEDEFAEFASSSRELASWLRGYDPKLRDLLDDSPGRLKDIRTLTSELSRTMPALLDDAVTLTDLVAARDPHLRELLAQFPGGAARLADTLRDGRFHVNLLITPGTLCAYDNEHELAPPTSTERQELDADNTCAASFSAQQRGAAHTPPAAR